MGASEERHPTKCFVRRWRRDPRQPRLGPSQLQLQLHADKGEDMALMFNRMKISDALTREFQNDRIDPFWLVDTERTHLGRRVTVGHIGAGMGHLVSINAGRGYALRAYRLVSSMVSESVEVTFQLQPDLWCQVSPETGHEPMVFDREHGRAHQGGPVTVTNYAVTNGTPCALCGVVTDGAYARNVFQGLRKEIADRLLTEHPNLYICPECTERTVERLDHEQLCSPESLADLVPLLRVEDEDVRMKLMLTLVSAGEPAIPYLIAGLSNTDERVRDASETALAMLCPASIPALLDCVREKGAGVRGAMMALLLQKEQIRPVLESIRDDPHNPRTNIAYWFISQVYGDPHD